MEGINGKKGDGAHGFEDHFKAGDTFFKRPDFKPIQP